MKTDGSSNFHVAAIVLIVVWPVLAALRSEFGPTQLVFRLFWEINSGFFNNTNDEVYTHLRPVQKKIHWKCWLLLQEKHTIQQLKLVTLL